MVRTGKAHILARFRGNRKALPRASSSVIWRKTDYFCHSGVLSYATYAISLFKFLISTPYDSPFQTFPALPKTIFANSNFSFVSDANYCPLVRLR